MARRSGALATGLVVAVVSGAVAATGVHPATPATTATTATTSRLPGFSIEGLGDIGSLPALTAGAEASMQRITFEPGASVELRYPGPVVYHVERGTLGLRPGNRRLAYLFSGGASLGQPLPPPPVDGETRLTPGLAVSADDDHLGPVRNAGNGPLVILALLVVPAPGPGEHGAASKGTTAVAATEPVGGP